ncbi:lantibiotic dehydratase C-terminal domain-containing protein [Sphaerimonospora sp. CA-214678]|uniref:lantibiotic dehydratase C-terminal domain-containing protein n=1 Tax=Sphaerimonospora sp. CA-214678 TaxID=3240029 RepID=UPI003D8C818F
MILESISQKAGEWQAVHIFYSSDSKPLLTECVAPLVRDLRDRGLLARYFFINYWLEGPHVRLRLKPARPELTDEVRRSTEEAIEAFLKRRPALYEMDAESMGEFYDEMFRLEYSEEERIARYGESGKMPFRLNNSYHYFAYEPEYRKYGGEEGVALAEWHFEHSSDLVLELVETTNVHLRTVMLGLATQLMMIMSATFLREQDEIAAFMDDYHHFWHDWFKLGNEQRDAQYESNLRESLPDLRRRFGEIHQAVTSAELNRLTTFGRAWAQHCADLRAKVVEYAESGKLLFPVRDVSGRRQFHGRGVVGYEPITDPEVALRILLSPYMHMTNNRLGASLVDESYLSYMLCRATGRDYVPVVGQSA